MPRAGFSASPLAVALAVALALSAAALFSQRAGAASRSASAATAVFPDDPAIRYTEYAHATISHWAAVFDRPRRPERELDRESGDADQLPHGCDARVDRAHVHVRLQRPGVAGASRSRRTGDSFPEASAATPSRDGDVHHRRERVRLLSRVQRRLPRRVRRWRSTGCGSRAVGMGSPLLSAAADDDVAFATRSRRAIRARPGTTAAIWTGLQRRKSWSVVNMASRRDDRALRRVRGRAPGGTCHVAIGANDGGTSKPMATFVSDYQALLDGFRVFSRSRAVSPDADLDRRRVVANGRASTSARLPAAIASVVRQRMIGDLNLHLSTA